MRALDDARAQGTLRKLRSRIVLRFTPTGAAGKQRGKKAKVLHKSLVVRFR